MTSCTRRTLALAVTLISLGCTAKQENASQDAANTAPQRVALATANYAFQAPDTLSAGWTTFHFTNKGDDVHYAHFVQLAAGRTATELVAAYGEAISTSAARPEWLTRFGGPGGAIPGGSSAVTQYMEPGTYVLLCPVEDSTGTPHFGKGEFTTVVVGALSSEASPREAAPSATATIRLVDFGFEVDNQLRAGKHTVRVSNVGNDGHDLVLMKLAPGVTLDDVRRTMNPEAARRTRREDEPPMSFDELGTFTGGVAAIRPGMDVFFDTTLERGDYVLLCMATANDGRSHIEHGMIHQVNVL
jgi:hypothetical protein